MRRFPVIALLALLGCGQDPTVVTPATFERPGAIAFVCVDTESSTLVTRELCEGVTGTTDDRYALVGLVTQTASGEVGAIDFRRRRVIDADPRVPGFTFTRVGEFPSGIAVVPDQPGVTYVAAYGSRSVEWYPTGLFLGGSVPVAEVRGSVGLSGGPTDLVISPDGTVAYVAIPAMGTIVPIPILADRSLGDATGEITPTVPADLPLPAVGAASDYRFTCAAEGDSVSLGTPDASRVRTEILGAGSVAEPHRLLVVDNPDPALDELLIADRQLPLIYRYTIEADGSLTELEPLAPGAPIRDLAVSPFVPVDITAGSESTRYLYAIDDTDQSVLVMDFDPASATFGAVLPVSFGQEQSDRLRVGKANALDVIARDYDPEDPDYCATPDGDEGPLNLRGVFLAVGLADGSMQVVDVVDLDGPCRGFECTPDDARADDSDQYVYIQRHRPRVANFVTNPVGTLGSPILTVDGVGRVADSVTGEEVINGLVPVTGVDAMGAPIVTCPAGQDHVFGELICATEDPWALRAERWTATYEGTIPGTTELVRLEHVEGTVYNFVLPVGREVFCDSGVLGRTSVQLLGEGHPESATVGDTIVITREPAESKRSEEECETYFEPSSTDTYEREFIELPIRQAYNDRLEVDIRFSLDTTDFMNCYDDPDSSEFIGIEVRLEQQFLVSGASTGFLHRVVARELDNLCVVDTAGQPIVPEDPATFRNGRARNGIVTDPTAVPPITEPAPYQNPYIAFTLDAIPVNDEASLVINLTGTPTPFSVPVGARPGRAPVITIVQDVVYSPVDERLYVLDSNASSLVQYEVAEFQVGNVFE